MRKRGSTNANLHIAILDCMEPHAVVMQVMHALGGRPLLPSLNHPRLEVLLCGTPFNGIARQACDLHCALELEDIPNSQLGKSELWGVKCPVR